MPNPPSLLNQQPQHIKERIVTLAQKQPYDVIIDWLATQGVIVSYTQLVYYIRTNNLQNRHYTIAPVQGYKAKAKTYLNELLKYDSPTFTVGNIHLHGASWSSVSVALRREGLIEPMRGYSPIRWRILATKGELREWMEKEVSE